MKYRISRARAYSSVIAAKNQLNFALWTYPFFMVAILLIGAAYNGLICFIVSFLYHLAIVYQFIHLENCRKNYLLFIK